MFPLFFRPLDGLDGLVFFFLFAPGRLFFPGFDVLLAVLDDTCTPALVIRTSAQFQNFSAVSGPHRFAPTFPVFQP